MTASSLSIGIVQCSLGDVRETNVARIEDLIREAARMYATTKPAAIQWGGPTEQNNNCTDFTRTAIGLMGISQGGWICQIAGGA